LSSKGPRRTVRSERKLVYKGVFPLSKSTTRQIPYMKGKREGSRGDQTLLMGTASLHKRSLRKREAQKQDWLTKRLGVGKGKGNLSRHIIEAPIRKVQTTNTANPQGIESNERGQLQARQ